MMAELSPEVRKALEEQKKNCIFCKIIKGEIKARKVFEDDLVIGLLDINPARLGHIILMPKEHYPILPFLPHKTFIRLFSAAKWLCSAAKKASVTLGSTVFIANGFAAGQQSQHFMLHIIPRDPRDGVLPESWDAASMGAKEREEVRGLLANNLLIMMERYFKEHPAPWHKPGRAPDFQSYSKQRVIQIIEQNPKLKQLLEEEPAEFARQVAGQPQLRAMFRFVDIKEIAEHFSPGSSAMIRDAELSGGASPSDGAKDEKEAGEKHGEGEGERDEIEEKSENSTENDGSNSGNSPDNGSDRESSEGDGSKENVSLDDISLLFR